MLQTIADDLKDTPAAYAELYSEWLDILKGMWDAIGKPADERRLKEYARHFGSVPTELLRKSVDRAIRENGNYQTVPTIGALWSAIRSELGNPYNIDQALYEWEQVRWNRVLVKSRMTE
jgi:hypothetical protein